MAPKPLELLTCVPSHRPPTGSGKSTLMTTLFRTLELESGRILIDDVDIANVPLDRLRSSLAIIPQVVGNGQKSERATGLLL